MDQRKSDERRETSLETFKILFLRDHENSNKARRVGMMVGLTRKFSQVSC